MIVPIVLHSSAYDAVRFGDYGSSIASFTPKVNHFSVRPLLSVGRSFTARCRHFFITSLWQSLVTRLFTCHSASVCVQKRHAVQLDHPSHYTPGNLCLSIVAPNGARIAVFMWVSLVYSHFDSTGLHTCTANCNSSPSVHSDLTNILSGPHFPALWASYR